MPRGDSTAAFLSALATDLLAVRDETRTVTEIVMRAVDAIGDADHASLTVRSAGRRRDRLMTLGSTDPTAVRADGLQYELGEGPSLEALGETAWVRTGEIGTDPRFPLWGPRAAELGYGSLLSVRLTTSGEAIGALNLYSVHRGCFVDPGEVELAVLFAAHASNALTSARQLAGLETAMSSRHVIGMAQGILMERYRLDEEQAFAFLARRSSQENRKLRELALEIVSDLPERPHVDLLD